MALLSSPPAGMPSGVVRGLGLIDDPEVTRARREKMAVLYGEVVDPAQGHRARAHGTAPPHGAEVDHVGGLMGAGGDGGGEGAGAGADPLDGSPTKWANKYGADSSLFRDAPPSRGWNSSTKVEEAPPPPTVAAPSEAHPDRHEFRASGPAGHQGGAAWVSAAKVSGGAVGVPMRLGRSPGTRLLRGTWGPPPPPPLLPSPPSQRGGPCHRVAGPQVDKSAEDAALRDTKGRPSGPLKPQFRSEKRNTQAVRGWNSSARVVRKDPCHPPPRSDYQAAVRKHVFRNETPSKQDGLPPRVREAGVEDDRLCLQGMFGFARALVKGMRVEGRREETVLASLETTSSCFLYTPSPLAPACVVPTACILTMCPHTMHWCRGLEYQRPRCKGPH